MANVELSPSRLIRAGFAGPVAHSDQERFYWCPGASTYDIHCQMLTLENTLVGQALSFATTEIPESTLNDALCQG